MSTVHTSTVHTSTVHTSTVHTTAGRLRCLPSPPRPQCRAPSLPWAVVFGKANNVASAVPAEGEKPSAAQIDAAYALAPEKAQLVTLRYFGGLTLPEAADALGVSLRTAERWWLFARSWLYAALLEDDEH